MAALLSDKEVINNAVTTSNDNHTARIVKKGDELEGTEEQRARDLIRKLHHDEYQRNRRRVAEIFDLVEQHKRPIEFELMTDEEDEDADLQ